MGQTIQLAFGPSGVLDFGQQRQKRGELHGNLGSSDSGCLSKSQRFCIAGILNRLAQRHFTLGCGNSDSPPQVQSVEQPWQQRRSFLELRRVVGAPYAPTTANAAEVESQKAKALASTEIYDSTLLVIDFDL